MKSRIHLFINLSSIVRFLKKLRQGVPYEDESWHAWSHEHYFLKHHFLNICRCAFKACDIQKISGSLLTVDFEKAFDSLNHKFLIAVLKKYGFGEDFIDWIKTLLRDQEFCVINGGHTTTLRSGTWC